MHEIGRCTVGGDAGALSGGEQQTMARREVLCVAWMAKQTPDTMEVSCGKLPMFCQTRFH